MQSIKSCSLFICLVSIACTMIELLLPSGKISKTMYTVMNLFIICTGIISFKNFHTNLKSTIPNLYLKKNLSETSKFLDSIDSQISNLACESIKNIVEDKLKSIEIPSKKIEIFMDTITDNCILMIKCKIYIESKFKDYKSKIYEEISKKLNISTEIVEV